MTEENHARDDGLWSRFLNLVITPYGLFSGLGFIVFIILTIGIFSSKGGFLRSLQDNEAARGLITFLVVFTTVSIALILALYTIISTVAGQDLKDRFGYGKEILTALIGILGTILGFYFASSTPGTAREATRTALNSAQALQVASALISNETPTKGNTVVITSFVSGGAPPYTYSMVFRPSDMISAITDKTSSDGVMKEDIKIPESVSQNTEFTFQILVRDSEGKSTVYDDKTKKFLVKTP